MSENHGKFCWVELSTTDVDAARSFYGEVVGWSVRSVPMPGMDYAMWIKPGSEDAAGGVSVLAEEAKAMGAPPHWLLHVAVDDIDATLAKATELGGTVLLPHTPIPGYGAFAILADPQGAAIGVFKGNDDSPVPGIEATLGGIAWHELMTSDLAGAQAFYGPLFGWETIDTMDMGEHGPYAMFGASAEQMWGGMMKRTDGMPSAWTPYFNVPDADVAATRTKAMGGQVFVTMDVPAGGRITMGMDPQGAVFAVHSMTGSTP